MTASERRLSLVHGGLAAVITLPRPDEQTAKTARRKRTTKRTPVPPAPGPGDAA